MSFDNPLFWTALVQIIIIDIILSGDNAVVIALAVRRLPPQRQKQAIFWGTGAAIVARIVLAAFAIALLKLPFLKLIGALALLWIGVKLMLPEDEGDHELSVSDSFVGAIKTIVVADVVMSVDNVIAVAAAAKDSLFLFALGIAISIPIIIFASQLLLKVMGRFPIIITLGAALLGFVAGEMAWTDPAVAAWAQSMPGWGKYALALAGAALVVAVGTILARRKSPPAKPAT
jgi:YjbE family integral membrane protein